LTAVSASDSATAKLSQFIHGVCAADLPTSTRIAARRALVNIIGCCLSGARHEIVDICASALLPMAGAPTASLLGRTERTDALTATMLNCLASAAYSFDDTHAQTILHPSGATAAALLALAEQRHVTGEAFLLAFVLGIDVASRVSKSVSVAPASGDIGWSQTGIAAGIGAAAAAASVLELDPQRIAWAIGMASLQASGFRASHGTMASTLIFGHAAHTGLRAAFLAQAGLGAPSEPLQAKYGYASLFASVPHIPYLTDSLGTQFEVEALGYKPYPCGIVIHPSLDAALGWSRVHRTHLDSITGVRLRTHPSALALGFRRHPNSELEAKVSLYHWVAAALRYGRAGIAEGEQAIIDDPQIVRLRNIIEVDTDAALAPDAAMLTVVLQDGEQQTISTAHCKGSMANPMSDDDLTEKFRGQAELVLAPSRSAELLERCWNVDQLTDAAEIARGARATQ
jgi:2-methylcitrate dehydratase PrpD